MAIPRIYVDEVCPLDGYEQLSVRILANPTGAEWTDWQTSHLGITDCAECAQAQPTPRGKHAKAPAERVYCPSCTQARERFGRSWSAFYGPRLLDADVSTPAAALALLDQDDLFPDEVLAWLIELPVVLWRRRRQQLGKMLGSSSISAS